MYIIARPFRKWETYLAALRRHWRGWLFSPGVSFRSGCFRDYEISFKL